jgi:uncharacterized membrane-anchored protein YhcB (DUF1043 family)
MSIWALVGVLVVVVIGAVILVFVGIRNPQQADERILQDRLEVLNQELSKRGEQLDLETLLHVRWVKLLSALPHRTH